MSAEANAEPAATGGDPLLEVTDLVKHFPIKRGLLIDREVDRVKAVDGVSFSVGRGGRPFRRRISSFRAAFSARSPPTSARNCRIMSSRSKGVGVRVSGGSAIA